MNSTSTNVHRVIKINVSEIQHAGEIRWQEVTFTMPDGSTHTVTAFLAEGYPGFQVFQRAEEPQRRIEDFPRQVRLNADLDLGPGNEGD